MRPCTTFANHTILILLLNLLKRSAIFKKNSLRRWGEAPLGAPCSIMDVVLFRQEEMGLGGETAWPEKERENQHVIPAGPSAPRKGPASVDEQLRRRRRTRMKWLRRLCCSWPPPTNSTVTPLLAVPLLRGRGRTKPCEPHPHFHLPTLLHTHGCFYSFTSSIALG
jgi:hypothetical protein